MASKIWSLHEIFSINIHSGEVDDDINFTYEDRTEVYYSCAASLNDEMWVLGGSIQKRQVNLKFLDKRVDINFL